MVYLSKLNIKINQTWANRPHIECLRMAATLLSCYIGWARHGQTSQTHQHLHQKFSSSKRVLLIISPEFVIRNHPCAYLYININIQKGLDPQDIIEY